MGCYFSIEVGRINGAYFLEKKENGQTGVFAHDAYLIHLVMFGEVSNDCLIILEINAYCSFPDGQIMPN